MPTYRFYKLTPGMRIAAPGEDRDFDGDISAFEHAAALANGHAVGLWEGPRFVANVESDSDPLLGQTAGRRPARSAG